MTTPTIRERVLARSDLDAMRAARQITELAAALNAEGVEAPQSRFITARAIVMLNPLEGRAILKSLRTAATLDIAVEFAVLFLSQEAGLDIGDADMWVELDHMQAAGVLTSAQVVLLKNLAFQPLVVTPSQVADALYYPDGTER